MLIVRGPRGAVETSKVLIGFIFTAGIHVQSSGVFFFVFVFLFLFTNVGIILSPSIHVAIYNLYFN